MPFNAGGSTTRTTKTSGGTTWASDAAASDPINATEFDTEAADIYAMLAKCITKDGNQTVTANIPMNSFKFTALVDPTSAQDSATKNYVDTKALLLASGGAVVGNTTFGGTLGVTGATTLSGSATVGTTLGVTGLTTTAGVAAGANDSSGRGMSIERYVSITTNSVAGVTAALDTYLQFAIPGAGTYAYEFVLFNGGSGTTGGLKISPYYSGTFTAAGSNWYPSGVANGAQAALNRQPVTGTVTTAVQWTANWQVNDWVLIKGTLLATGAGTFGLTWAQSANTAPNTNLGNVSYMTLTQLS